MANEALREQNTHRVLEEAIVCFQEYGVEETKISEIAKRAGVNQRSIYRYFGSKDNLVLQAVYHFWMRIFSGWSDDFRRRDYQEKSGLEQIRFILMRHYSQFGPEYVSGLLLQDIDSYIHRHHLSEASYMQQERSESPGEKGYSVLFKDFQALYSPMGDAIRKGIKDGSIRTQLSAEDLQQVVSHIFMGVLHRMSVQYNYCHVDFEKTIKPQFGIVLQMIYHFLESGQDTFGLEF